MEKNSFLSVLGNSLVNALDIIYIGILWLLCCLPIITIGASSTAMYYCMVKCVRHGRGHAGREFFAAFRRNFGCSTKAWFVFLLLILLWLGNNLVRSQTDPEALKVMTMISKYLIVPVCIPLPWLFAYISRFDNSVVDTLKFSVFLSVKNFPRTLIMLLTAAAFVLIGRMLPVLIPLLPGFCCLIMSYQTEPVFKSITAQMENDGNEDQWYNE
ncbi:MAG: YesL family protein [Oscillospiraceae bacterium]|nr:YesL family protein [Oscillospiraceae bacterium]